MRKVTRVLWPNSWSMGNFRAIEGSGIRPLAPLLFLVAVDVLALAIQHDRLIGTSSPRTKFESFISGSEATKSLSS